VRAYGMVDGMLRARKEGQGRLRVLLVSWGCGIYGYGAPGCGGVLNSRLGVNYGEFDPGSG
jgi:hypothetical protein